MKTDSFFGKYRLLERLGVGGMAEVYRAALTGAEGFYRELTLKCIRPELSGDPDFEHMFIDEARIAAKLHHPNIVQIFDFDRVGDLYYIAMEYVHGQDLAAMSKRVQSENAMLPLDIALYIEIEFLSGLRYAHEKTERGVPLNIIHRDISPSNVLLSYNGEVKLSDFGIAKAIFSISKTRTGELKGKYAYMAPEQVEGKSIDHRCDIFAAGTVLYEMLTQKRAFSGPSEFKTLERIIKGEVQPIRELRPEIPPELEKIVSRSIATQPKKRFQNTVEFINALEVFCEHARIQLSDMVLSTYLKQFFDIESIQPKNNVLDKNLLKKRIKQRRYANTVPFKGKSEKHPDSPKRFCERIKHNHTYLRVGLILGLVILLGNILFFWIGPFVQNKREITVLMRMIPEQQQWYHENAFIPFERAHHVQIRTISFDTLDEIPEILRTKRVDLVKIPLALTRALAQEGLIIPVENILQTKKTQKIISEFDPFALELARIRSVVENPICYIPRKLETLCIVYRQSKVQDAIANWRKVSLDLERDLIRLTGHGLPRGYYLENDVTNWDSYDELMVHYYWSRVKQEDGRIAPRVTRLTYPCWATFLVFMSDLAGFDKGGRLTLNATQAMVDVFEWYALYRELGLYHPRVWSAEMDMIGNIESELLARGEVYWMRTHSLGIKRIWSGFNEENHFSTLPDIRDDLEISPMTQKVSLELTRAGKYARLGTHKGVVSAWFWAIPASSSDPSLSCELALFLTGSHVHEQDVREFMIQPVRNNVDFGGNELALRVFKVIESQMKENNKLIVPREKSTEKITQMMKSMFNAWETIILAKGYLQGEFISREQIKTLLEKEFTSTQ